LMTQAEAIVGMIAAHQRMRGMANAHQRFE